MDEARQECKIRSLHNITIVSMLWEFIYPSLISATHYSGFITSHNKKNCTSFTLHTTQQSTWSYLMVSLFHCIMINTSLEQSLAGDKVSILIHTCPHKPRGWITGLQSLSRQPTITCGLMSDLVICKRRKSMVIQDTGCPYGDQVSLNNTNSFKQADCCLMALGLCEDNWMSRTSLIFWENHQSPSQDPNAVWWSQMAI